MKVDGLMNNKATFSLPAQSHQIGRAMFADKWSGRECTQSVIPLLPDDWVDAEPLELIRANDLLVAYRPDFGRNRITFGRGITVIVPEIEFSPLEWEAARELDHQLHTGPREALGRFDRVTEQMAARLRTGELVSALRPTAGGAIGQPMPATDWQTEQWRQRFYWCRMNPHDPFGVSDRVKEYPSIVLSRKPSAILRALNSGSDPTAAAPGQRWFEKPMGDDYQWIFVTRRSLDHCLKHIREPKATDNARGDKSRSFADSDAKLIEVMRAMLEAGEAKSVQDAARQIAKSAERHGELESAVQRLQRAYGRQYPQRRRR